MLISSHMSIFFFFFFFILNSLIRYLLSKYFLGHVIFYNIPLNGKFDRTKLQVFRFPIKMFLERRPFVRYGLSKMLVLPFFVKFKLIQRVRWSYISLIWWQRRSSSARQTIVYFILYLDRVGKKSSLKQFKLVIYFVSSLVTDYYMEMFTFSRLYYLHCNNNSVLWWETPRAVKNL